ncbi:MAG: ABC transporter ATP-binding protein [Humibacillus sp.]|nr:ABC transporter ATP-binding protein [Humibacillus sp.]
MSHTFAAGAVTALTGASGRGKSTLLYMLGLMLTPTAGAVILDGKDVGAASDADRSRIRARQLGFVFQDAALDPTRTVLDSVLEPSLYAGIPRAVAECHARARLEDLGLSARADHRPGEISGGQAQRVAICRALVNDPVVVLADEPTGNLDRGNAEIVLSALRGATGQGRTVVIATHDPFVIAHTDHEVAL